MEQTPLRASRCLRRVLLRAVRWAILLALLSLALEACVNSRKSKKRHWGRASTTDAVPKAELVHPAVTLPADAERNPVSAVAQSPDSSTAASAARLQRARNAATAHWELAAQGIRAVRPASASRETSVRADTPSIATTADAAPAPSPSVALTPTTARPTRRPAPVPARSKRLRVAAARLRKAAGKRAAHNCAPAAAVSIPPVEAAASEAVQMTAATSGTSTTDGSTDRVSSGMVPVSTAS